MATRLPLRAVPREVLDKTWAQGRTYYQYERREPRALAMEKPIEDMTLDELIATQDREPLSESRRMFLHLGAKVLSGDNPLSAASTTALFELVADNGPKCLFDAVDLELADDETDDLTASDKYFTPWTLTDFITQRQITWEKERAQCGPEYRLRIEAAENGRLNIRNIGRGILPSDNWIDIARKALAGWLETYGRVETWDQLQERIALIQDMLDDPVAYLYRDPDWREERERFIAPDDRIVHSSYEELDEDGNLLVHHRSPRQNPDWETWHHAVRRDSSDPLELGFDLCSNSELESLLGVQAWDDEGNALDANREEFVRSIA